MRRLAGLGLLGLLFLGSVVETPAGENDEMQQAIERGVAALQRMQTPDGIWSNKEIGVTALATLIINPAIGLLLGWISELARVSFVRRLAPGS